MLGSSLLLQPVGVMPRRTWPGENRLSAAEADAGQRKRRQARIRPRRRRDDGRGTLGTGVTMTEWQGEG
jgi:hypothetical protein